MRPGQALSTGAASMSVELGCTPKEKHPRMVGVQYATGEESSRKNEEHPHGFSSCTCHKHTCTFHAHMHRPEGRSGGWNGLGKRPAGASKALVGAETLGF